VRAAGLVLIFVGLIAVIVGTMSGCGTFFGWNGRHAVDAVALAEGRTTRTLTPAPGRRYTVSVQVVFDRESVELKDGVADLHASFPLVVRVTDKHRTVRAETAGWLDPTEPPNVPYGEAVKEGEKSRTELSVERLVGPFIASSHEPLSVDVELGADRIGRARVAERRLVIYDDALPPRIKTAFTLAGVGAAALLAGVALTVAGWLRGRRSPRRGGRKRGGIPASDVV
jgi:hypothetical protein